MTDPSGNVTEETREPSGWRLEQAVSAFQQLREALASDDDLDADEAAILTALASANDDDVLNLIARLIDATIWAERRELEAKSLEYEYRDRRRRYAERYERLRQIIAQMMEAVEKRRVAGRLATASIGEAPPSLIVTDEKAIPAEWWVIERTLRRGDLGKHIRETGELVPGATLSNGGSSLTLRKVR